MSRRGIEPGPRNARLALYRSKELFEQRINSYSEHLHMSPRQNEKIQCMKVETGRFLKVDYL
jgi:hypothetical protein